MGGIHNLENALAAVAAAASAGVSLEQAVDAMSRFEGVKRRMERTATVANIAIYDDFAHHPTAIAKSIRQCASVTRASSRRRDRTALQHHEARRA